MRRAYMSPACSKLRNDSPVSTGQESYLAYPFIGKFKKTQTTQNLHQQKNPLNQIISLLDALDVLASLQEKMHLMPNYCPGCCEWTQLMDPIFSSHLCPNTLF